MPRRRKVSVFIEGKMVHSYETDRPLSAALASYVNQARQNGTDLDRKLLRIEGAGRSRELLVEPRKRTVHPAL